MKELVEEIIANVRQALIEIGLHELEPEGRNKVIDGMLHRAIIKAKELEAALSPRPIEEAPRDGSPVLVLFKCIGWRVCTWETPHYADDFDDEDRKIWCIDDNKNGPVPMRGYRDGDDTHWLPLPSMDGGKSDE